MAGTITIKGTGRVSVPPDWAVLSLYLETLKDSYEEAMDAAAERIDKLEKALTAAGFSAESLKTEGFRVDTRYESRETKAGKTVRVFLGYVCAHRLRFAFAFSPEQLGRGLGAVADSGAEPEISISFTVKDPEAVSDALLRDAAENARRKAEVLCAASGAALGALRDIVYSWGELDVLSDVDYRLDKSCMPSLSRASCACPNIAPEDLQVQDTVTFVWEIR